MKKYILSFDDATLFNAGLKAPADCEKKIKEMGYVRIRIPLYQTGNRIKNKTKNLLKYTALFHIEKESIVVIQHPQYVRGIYMDFLRWMKKIRRCKLIFVIHDLESLRQLFTDNIEEYQKLDQMMYQIADVMIAHNEKMKTYLMENCKIPQKKIVVLGVFDYLIDESVGDRGTANKEDGVIIAGNLDKNKTGYIYKLTELRTKTIFNLYGVNWSKNETSDRNWNYKGAFKPEELPSCMEGAFGLVWDGSTIEACDGPSGRYVQYNNPHKVSLYIASGIPIIIWKKAALADFVQEKKIGIVIENLNEIDQVIDAISEEQYEIMKDNISEISEKVRSGYFIKSAIEKAEEIVNESK
ncbi:MAG: hypothetical protein PHN80_12580 [Hespellia sp.]|nr:hypothetical protein [Hespellia sp.]